MREFVLFRSQRGIRSRISTGHGTCESNGFPAGMVFQRQVHEARPLGSSEVRTEPSSSTCSTGAPRRTAVRPCPMSGDQRAKAAADSAPAH
ncbi:hypothetical protein C0Q61_31080 [Streptomyces albidoflavus]|nr:hypothetical protein C0Q61_31080 [Streptomyces albidoflavus]